ncbi:hypothetical protein SNE40_009755 [Patella caerulea]|uniref:Uncharacterized protein n=1 Tax=Patella caerulea TaxID=87958 RepID=A0AAN8Q3N3_PATCE
MNFMNHMYKYADLESEVAKICIESCGRHLWYFTPQLIVLALCDDGLSKEIREELTKLFNTPKSMDFKPGEPEFPKMIQRDGEIKLEGRLMSPNSWV